MVELTFSIKELFNKLNIFKRNKKPVELKIISLLDYIFHGSYRKIASKLSAAIYSITKTSIYRYVKKFQSSIKLSIKPKERTMIAVDETVIKDNGRKCYLWAALDIHTKELIAFDVSYGRSELDAIHFLAKVKARCKGKLPIVLSDKGPWYKDALSRLGFEQWTYTFNLRNAIERFFRYIKERTKIFYNNINSGNGIKHIVLFMKMFAYWYKEWR